MSTGAGGCAGTPNGPEPPRGPPRPPPKPPFPINAIACCIISGVIFPKGLPGVPPEGLNMAIKGLGGSADVAWPADEGGGGD